jgi:hypothetical protein
MNFEPQHEQLINFLIGAGAFICLCAFILWSLE